MPAVSKAQQRFMGMVYAVKKGEMSAPSSEVADAAASMKKKDAKDFASTKHKGLPEKKVTKEAKDFSQRDEIMKRAKPLHKHLYKTLHKKDMSGDVNETFTIDPKAHRQQQRAKKIRDRTKTGDEGSEIAKKKVKGPALFGETAYYKSSSKYQKKVADSEKRHKEQDKRMKFGKFYDKAKEARDRLRPGEVKRYDKKLGKYVSNKD
jgi:hypothetical protein